MEQDKRKRVVTLDKTIYVEKCLSILGTNQFMKLKKNKNQNSQQGNTKSLIQLVPILTDFMELQRYIKLIEMMKNINSLYTTQQYPTLAQDHVNLLNILPIYCQD